MSDKDFKVKNKLQVKGITTAGPVLSDASGNIDSVAYLATQYGGMGTTTSPSSGQIPFSSVGTTYSPTALNTLDVKGATYSSSAPSNPVAGQIWIDTTSTATAYDPNLIRRYTFTATAGQTVFITTLNFVDTYEQVYFNGVLLVRTSDYTTSNSNTITLTAGAIVGDIIEVVCITNLSSVNTYTQAEITSAILAAVPAQAGNTGKYLTTNGSATSWGTINALPSQTGNTGKYLTTDGSSASWGTLNLSSYATTTSLNNDEILLYMGAF